MRLIKNEYFNSIIAVKTNLLIHDYFTQFSTVWSPNRSRHNPIGIIETIRILCSPRQSFLRAHLRDHADEVRQRWASPRWASSGCWIWSKPNMYSTRRCLDMHGYSGGWSDSALFRLLMILHGFWYFALGVNQFLNCWVPLPTGRSGGCFTWSLGFSLVTRAFTLHIVNTSHTVKYCTYC